MEKLKYRISPTISTRRAKDCQENNSNEGDYQCRNILRFSKTEIAFIVIAFDDDSVFAVKLFLQLLVNLVGQTRWRDTGG